MTRAEKVVIAQAMRREGGLTKRQIAAVFGVSRSTVSYWFSDPDRSKQDARHARYRGRCLDCGKPTDGTAGPGKASQRCNACRGKHQEIWSREAIVEAIHTFHTLHGRPPSANDWNPAMLNHHSFSDARRREIEAVGRGWPRVAKVQQQFGSWSNALRVAGFEPSRGGRSAWR